MDQTTKGGYPQAEYPPPTGFPQASPAGYPQAPPAGYPQGPPAGYPQGGYLPPTGFPQGPPAGYPQGGYLPPTGFPQGPPAGYPQGGYLPPTGFPQGPPAGYPQGVPPGGYSSPGAVPKPDYPPAAYPSPQPGFAAVYGETAGNTERDNFGEDVDVKGFDFSEKSIRRGFIRKVYAILMTQLAATLGVISLFTYHMPTRVWVSWHPSLLWIALIAVFVCVIAMACCEDVRRKAPMNFIFLGIFTVAESFLLGVVTTRFESQEVMMAVGITAAICLALTLFAMQTRFDFTAMGGALLCILVVFIMFGFIAIFLHQSKILSLVYSSIGALIFSLYLIYDTQMMMGGEHKYSISPEEYVFAALTLYLDVINIFLYILRIIGASRG